MSPASRIKIHGPLGSLKEFVAISGEMIRSSGLKQSTTGLWWRGQGDAHWSLLPTLYRSPINHELERETVRDFKLKSLPFISGRRPELEIEWLFLMQHHGAPTRILDWTESPLVALYFAVVNFENDKDAAVWALHPWMLNVITTKQQSVPTARSVNVAPWLIDTEDPSVPRAPQEKLPLAVRVEYGFNRAHSQRGAATIHGTSKKPIDALKEEAEDAQISNTSRQRLLQKILIDKSKKFSILKSLYEYGISADILFPDLDGLATALKFRYDHRYLELKRSSDK